MPTANTASFRIIGLNTYEAYDVDIRAAINDNDEGTATTAEYYSAAASDTNTLSGLAAPGEPARGRRYQLRGRSHSHGTLR